VVAAMSEQMSMYYVHRAENNPESQAHLTANRAKLNRKCAEVLRRLESGERLTVLGCANSGIASLPRRILDLKESGIAVQDQWVNGVKEYFL
jgi:16S rRNA G1207 methylase RsmC